MYDKYRIDNHKLIYHPERVSQWIKSQNSWEKAKKVYPIYMEISPIGTCNHRCNFCGLDFIGYQNVKIEKEILKANLKDMASNGVKSIMFAGEGEPSLYKDLPEIMDYCTEIEIDTSLTTNMVPFTDKNIECFVKNASWIKVSINAGNSKAYSKIHNTKPEDFNKVMENMKKAVAFKKNKGYKCTLGAQMLLLPDNVNTVVELAQKVKAVGLDYLVIKPYSQHPLSTTTKYKDVDYSKYLYLDNELKEFNTDKFKVIFRKNTMEKLTNKDSEYEKCNATPFFWGYIASNGDVYGCSCFLGNKNFCYGNINEELFSKIWEGDKRKAGLEFIHNTLDIKNCRKNCRMDEVNRYLWSLSHPNHHVNFI